MRHRLSAVLLAAGLCVSVFSMSVFADETESELQQAVEEMAEEETTLAEEEAETQSEAVTPAEEQTPAESEAQTEALSQEEQMKAQLSSMLTQIGAWSDEQIDAYIDGNDASSAAIAANWKSVKDELGAFVEVTDAEMEMTEDAFKIVGHAKYDKLNDKTDVVVTYEADMATQAVTMNWEVDYPLGTLMQRAALNTVMGLGIVFLTLLFLSWLIGKLHYIPEMIEKTSKKEAPEAVAPVQTAAPAAAPVAAVEEDLTDDLELVAVITAAIAASGTTSGDGFVVRSIKKANKRNWQRA